MHHLLCAHLAAEAHAAMWSPRKRETSGWGYLGASVALGVCQGLLNFHGSLKRSSAASLPSVKAVRCSTSSEVGVRDVGGVKAECSYLRIAKGAASQELRKASLGLPLNFFRHFLLDRGPSDHINITSYRLHAFCSPPCHGP